MAKDFFFFLIIVLVLASVGLAEDDQHKWDHRTIKYALSPKSDKINLDHKQILHALGSSFDRWANYVNLVFVHVDDTDDGADIKIKFMDLKQEEDFEKFGKNQISHVFLPPLGSIHLDSLRTWGTVDQTRNAKSSDQIFDLETVANQVIGEAIGVDQGYTDLKANTVDLEIPKDMIKVARKLYGPASFRHSIDFSRLGIAFIVLIGIVLSFWCIPAGFRLRGKQAAQSRAAEMC